MLSDERRLECEQWLNAYWLRKHNEGLIVRDLLDEVERLQAENARGWFFLQWHLTATDPPPEGLEVVTFDASHDEHWRTSEAKFEGGQWLSIVGTCWVEVEPPTHWTYAPDRSGDGNAQR